MPTLDVQGDVRRRLAAALAPVDVRVSVPDPRPGELIVVTRSGGRRLDGLRDRAGVDVLCWAPTEARARELADAADEAMRSLPFSGGYALVEQEVARSDRDMDSGSPRWYLSYTVTTYKY